MKELDCSGNQLKDYLPILSSGLKKLNCSHNKLTYMNLGILYGLNLEEVDCSNNEITNIVMDSVGELVKFDCSNNDLMTRKRMAPLFRSPVQGKPSAPA